MFENLLTGVESSVVTQGIAFLFSQANELIRHRRASSHKAEAPSIQAPDGIFTETSGGVHPARTDVLELVSDQLDAALNDLSSARRASTDSTSRDVVLAALRVRKILVAVYGVPLEFRQEGGEEQRDGPRIGVYIAGDVQSGGNVAGRSIHIKNQK
ncbi:hypothetical protein [uncultured Amnibacterium sp.]|uniref:hypothetical protein n=1 Tax=uncultured Amnibacterium sp. TaxID=1631851 RepID=UPI0035CA30D3